MEDINILLFDNFETLDAFGPAEVFGRFKDKFNLIYFSVKGGTITSSQNIQVHTLPLDQINPESILLIPGGQGTRTLIHDNDFINSLKELAQKSIYCLTVCTGSALLAKTGLLKGLSATSNKRAFSFAESTSNEVNWQYCARWCRDGKYYTSSGVSAGIDMSLGFIGDILSIEDAKNAAWEIEYIWNDKMDFDPFAL